MEVSEFQKTRNFASSLSFIQMIANSIYLLKSKTSQKYDTIRFRFNCLDSIQIKQLSFFYYALSWDRNQISCFGQRISGMFCVSFSLKVKRTKIEIGIWFRRILVSFQCICTDDKSALRKNNHLQVRGGNFNRDIFIKSLSVGRVPMQ